MTSLIAKLEQRARQAESLLCVGLDPHPADLPAHTPSAARNACLKLIEETADLAAAYKPNAAFFEELGPGGWQALKDVIEAVPASIPVILDAKRGDIASTANAYAHSAFDVLGADAITLNPYMGSDSVAPFLSDPAHGAFILCKTSNPGATELQDLQVSTRSGVEPLFRQVARLASLWNTHDNVGLVVGATQPDALTQVRRAVPQMWILAPGVGAQGGDLQAALQAGLRADGLGLLIPVSRAIARSAHPRLAAMELLQSIHESRPSQAPQEGRLSAEAALLADGLLEAGCVQFGDFTLRSGLHSPIYIDLRRLISHPDLLGHVARAYLSILANLEFQRVAALPYAGIPIATAVGLLGGHPMIYARKEQKEYGTRAAIEGEYSSGERVVILDDLATTGDTKLEAIAKLHGVGLVLQDIVVLIDRESGAKEVLAAAGYHLHAALTLSQLLDHWQQQNSVQGDLIAQAREFLSRQPAGR